MPMIEHTLCAMERFCRCPQTLGGLISHLKRHQLLHSARDIKNQSEPSWPSGKARGACASCRRLRQWAHWPGSSSTDFNNNPSRS